MQKILENRMLISVSLSVILTFVFVFAVAYSTTTISTNISTGNLTVTGTAGITGVTTMINASTTNLTVSGISYLTGVTTMVNASTTQALTVAGVSYLNSIQLNNGETIDNAIDGVIRTNATSSVNGLATTTAEGIIMPRVVSAIPVVCSATYDGGLIFTSKKIFCYCDGTAGAWYQATTTVGVACKY